MHCRRFIVSGRVQGVFYRATAASKARSLGIKGHALNLPDGRVEVLACGSEDAVRTFGEWLWIGSSGSNVTGVEASDAAPAQLPKGFGTG